MEPEAKPVFYPNLQFGGNASSLAIVAEIETEETYEQKLEAYEALNYRFIPMPEDGTYYDRDKETIVDLAEDQFIEPDATIREVFERLVEQPFLLIDRLGQLELYVVSSDEYYFNIGSAPPHAEPADIDKLKSDYPVIVEEFLSIVERRYQIITLADLNRRAVGEELYPIIAELEDQMAQLIRSDVDDSIELYPQLPSHVIGRREKDKLQDIETHIVEYLGLRELMKVIKGRPQLLEETGFSSASKWDDVVGSINQTRNRVMHANRTLIRNREDVTKTLERVDDAHELIATLHDVPLERIQGQFTELLMRDNDED